MRKEIDELITRLEKLKSDFNNQLTLIDNDINEFHKVLLDLVSKYPEHKDIVEFIIFVNDKIKLEQIVMKEVILDTFNELIQIKTETLKIFNQENEDTTNNIMTYLQSNDFKHLIYIVAFIIFILMVIIAPDSAKTLLNMINPFKGA